MLEASLAEREFIPVIERIDAVDSISTPSHWQVRTDRGPATLVLKGEEDIRHLSAQHLLITSREGVQFQIPQFHEPQLDRPSFKRIERFSLQLCAAVADIPYRRHRPGGGVKNCNQS